MRWRRGERVDPSERRRRPAEQIVEDVDQQQPGEESRQRHAECRDDPAEIVQPPIRLQRRQHAERDADAAREQQPEQRQLGGSGQAGDQLRQHRLPGRDRQPEIAARQIADIVEKLHRQAAVEAERGADLRDRFRRRRRPREIRGGVAGQRAGQQEGHDDDADQCRQRRTQPQRRQPQHQAVFDSVR